MEEKVLKSLDIVLRIWRFKKKKLFGKNSNASVIEKYL